MGCCDDMGRCGGDGAGVAIPLLRGAGNPHGGEGGGQVLHACLALPELMAAFFLVAGASGARCFSRGAMMAAYTGRSRRSAARDQGHAIMSMTVCASHSFGRCEARRSPFGRWRNMRPGEMLSDGTSERAKPSEMTQKDFTAVKTVTSCARFCARFRPPRVIACVLGSGDVFFCRGGGNG